jgi:two-component system response regulator HydG
MSADDTLLRACSILFLFRALAQTEDEVQRALIESQILSLIGDLGEGASDAAEAGPDLGGRRPGHGFILLAAGNAALSAAARERGLDVSLIERVCSKGALDGAVPLYAHDAIAGVVAAPGIAAGTLGAVATLASAALENVREVENLRVRNALLEEKIQEEIATGMVGHGAPMVRLQQMIARLAPLETTVLILGESGTGKEMVARALHSASPRKDDPFVAINCAALSSALLESELFGHEKGAFTDAHTQKKGKLELAGRGTIFLDEIGELAHELQAKLLRVLQQREFERVGGTKTLHLDARLITATNRDLADEVRRGVFREDLYHRLNVVAVRTPPLRECREDIPLLARHFLARAARRCGRRVESISPEAEQCLAAYTWPGNVRELENAIERAVVLGESPEVLVEDLPESVLETAAPPGLAGGYQALVGDAKRESIVRAWNESHGDYKAAAQMLGLHPNSLLRLVRNLGLRERLKN